MQRGRVPCLSFWVYFHNISIVLICSSIHHPECIHFLGTEAAFSFCSCVASNTVRSWSPAQDHSHQNSLVSNPMKSYQTFSLQTYECLKLETRGSVIIRSTGNLWVYALSELFMGKKEHSVRTGSETFFQLLTRSLGSKLSITHVGNTLSLQSWIHAVLAKMRWLFYFLLSSSSLLNPQEQSAGAFQWGYWIFYWQASTKELVPIATIWKSLFPQGSHKGGAHPFLHHSCWEQCQETHHFQWGL